MGDLTAISQILNCQTGRENSTAKSEPEPEICQFCGASLPWRKHEIPELGYTTWFRPGRCNCPGAAQYWAEVDRRAAEEEKKRAEEETRRKKLWYLEKSRLPRWYWACTFAATKETPDNRTALAKVKSYAQNFTGAGGLFLTGPVGTGKTHLAACLVNELIQRETRVLFGNVLDLLGRLRRSYDPEAQEEEWRIIDELSSVPLLVIDDLGKEKVSEWVEQTLYRIVDARYRENKALVVTSNFILSEFERRYDEVGPALVSRIVEMCEGIRLTGRDWRQTRKGV